MRAPRRLFALVPTVALVLALGACSSDDVEPRRAPDESTLTAPTSRPDDEASATPSPPDETGGRPRFAGTVATGLEVPWGIAFLPDGTALIAERDSALIKALGRSGDLRTAGEVPGVVPSSEGGLLGLAVSPSFDQDQMIYAYFSTAEDNRVVRMEYDGRSLGEPEPILTGIPVGSIHNGGRLLFGPDEMLYVSTGETGDADLAQDPDSLGGKILRTAPDGSVPSDNPDPDSPVWTSGHRNVQGLAFDDRDRLWATEFGSDVWDELNLIEAGNNYGWPAAEGDSDLLGFVDPRVQWQPENASPSGLAFADGHLWAASLRGERLWRIPVRSDGSVGAPEAFLLGDYGRLRTAVRAPDGSVWVSTSNHDGRGTPGPQDDRILELRP